MSMFHSPYNKKLFFCLVAGSLFLKGFGQLDEKNFTLYSQREGLSSNMVSGIAQDPLGYLWISTRNGLNRYNGTEFFQFHSDSSNNSLPTEEISKIQWLDEFHLAALTSMGLNIVDIRTRKTSNIIIPPAKLKFAFKVNTLVAVLSHKQAGIFILTRSGFYHYNTNNQLIFRFDYYTEEQAASSFAFGNNLLWLDEKNILITAIDGMYLYDFGNRRIKKLSKNENSLLAEFAVLPHSDYMIRQIAPGELIIFLPSTNKIIYVDSRNHRNVVSSLPIYPLQKEFGYRTNLFRI